MVLPSFAEAITKLFSIKVYAFDYVATDLLCVAAMFEHLAVLVRQRHGIELF